MESLSWASSFSTSRTLIPPQSKLRPASVSFTCRCSSVKPDPWSLSDGNPDRPKPRSQNPKKSLSDDNARRIIKAKAEYLSILRRNQGPRVQTPRWIKRTPEQMVQYLEDDQNGQMYGKHVVAAIKTVRALGQRKGQYDMRRVMAGFVCKLTFREMCVVLKEQKGWRQVRDFFSWMKLQVRAFPSIQFNSIIPYAVSVTVDRFITDEAIIEQLSYRPSVIVYTIVLRNYGQAGKIKLAEEIFLEMLESRVEPDEIVCGTMLCTYARWGRHKAMLSFYTAAVEERGLVPTIAVFNFMLSSLQKKSLHQVVINLWKNMLEKKVRPTCFTYTVVISSMLKQGNVDEARKLFYEMKNVGFTPEEVTYGLLITVSAKSGNLDEAESLYGDLRSRRIVPSNFTCASLLSLYCKKGDYSKALSLFLDMEKLRVQVDEVIYGLLIIIYGKLGLYEDAERTFKEVEQLGLLSKEKTYLAMASVQRCAGNAEKASSTIKLMKSRNVGLKLQLQDPNHRTLQRE